MSNSGNFSKNYIKQVEVRDLDGNPVEILLKYSARTPLLYMNYFETDMFDDLSKVVIQLAKKDSIVKKIDESGAESLTENDMKDFNMSDLFDFFHKFAVSLVATAHHPKPLSYEFISDNMLPEDFVTNPEYEPLFIAVKDLFAPATEDYKKKLMQVASGFSKRKI